jgi:hypothetical protein
LGWGWRPETAKELRRRIVEAVLKLEVQELYGLQFGVGVVLLGPQGCPSLARAAPSEANHAAFISRSC